MIPVPLLEIHYNRSEVTISCPLVASTTIKGLLAPATGTQRHLPHCQVQLMPTSTGLRWFNWQNGRHRAHPQLAHAARLHRHVNRQLGCSRPDSGPTNALGMQLSSPCMSRETQLEGHGPKRPGLGGDAVRWQCASKFHCWYNSRTAQLRIVRPPTMHRPAPHVRRGSSLRASCTATSA